MKKILRLAFMVIGISLILTACAGTIPEETISELSVRMALNSDAIGKMNDYGFINESEEKKLTKAIDKIHDDILALLSGNNNAKARKAGQAISYIYSEGSDTTIYSSIEAMGIGSGHIGFSEDDVLTMGELGAIELMVLKDLGDIGTSVDTIMDSVDKYMVSKRTPEDFKNYLLAYFQDAKIGDDIVTVELPDILKLTKGNGSGSNSRGLGYDFVIKGETDPPADEEIEVKPVADLRLMEVNKDFLDIVLGITDGSDPNYILHRDGNTKKLILLNYPASYMESLIVDPDLGAGKYIVEYETSKDLYVNLKSGNLKRKVSGDIFEDVIQIEGRMLSASKNDLSTVVGSKTINSIDSSFNGGSFIAKGSGIMPVSLKLTGSGSGSNWEVKGSYDDVSSGLILLRDYIEVVYMPKVVPGEDWVATGRKLRFTRFGGEATDIWANYIDNSGSLISDDYLPGILLKDLVADSATQDVLMKVPVDSSLIGTWVNEPSSTATSTNPNTTTNSNNTSSGDPVTDADGRPNSNLLEGSLPILYSDTMKLATEFPGTTVGKVDVGTGNNTRLPMYGMKIDKNKFETKLYNGWIMSEDMLNNVAWWNTWLSKNGFNYQLDINDLYDYFTGTYGYDTTINQYISFNVDTIKKLQRDIDDGKAYKTASIIRSVFIILGIILMWYGLLIIGAWVFDVNIVMGPKLVSLMTFGNWVAVTQSDDTDGLEGVRLADFKTIVVLGISITAIGIALTMFDAVGLIIWLLRTLSSFSDTIYNLFFT